MADHGIAATARMRRLGLYSWVSAAFDASLGVVDEVFGVDLRDVEGAKQIAYGLSARDAIHAAVMRSHGVQRILSFDTGFNDLPGIERLG